MDPLLSLDPNTHTHNTPHYSHTTSEVLDPFLSETVVHYGKRSRSLKRQQVMQFEIVYLEMFLFPDGLRITSLKGWRPVDPLHHSHLHWLLKKQNIYLITIFALHIKILHVWQIGGNLHGNPNKRNYCKQIYNCC